MVIGYYHDLLGIKNVGIYMYSVAYLKKVHSFRCSETLSVLLSALPTTLDIQKTVFALPKGKAPQPDGFFCGILH